ncbi:MAG TPA: hypothetical protein VNQ78_06515 [Paracoccus sp. (in: a-proteobacteria)]|uniref:hypothetical protein n=1 Tax=Paracoccus sp. TaxID=267 RepID=UPI002BF4FBF1|nr:hypothetical protein [Paracoccus sp. (in: a-proteobacteria)]HWL56317.1 hypothetical protein [Paracoccus sp. (in: a-proteobacteria)]
MWQPDPRNPYTLIEWNSRCFMVEHRPDVHYIAHQDDGTTTPMSAPQAPAIWEDRDGQWRVVGNDMTCRIIMDLCEAQRPAEAATMQPVEDLVPTDIPDQPTGQGASTKTSFISPDAPWRDRLKPVFSSLAAEGLMRLEDGQWQMRVTKKAVLTRLGDNAPTLPTFEREKLTHEGYPLRWGGRK